jgi:hypothetical protein
MKFTQMVINEIQCALDEENIESSTKLTEESDKDFTFIVKVIKPGNPELRKLCDEILGTNNYKVDSNSLRIYLPINIKKLHYIESKIIEIYGTENIIISTSIAGDYDTLIQLYWGES